jgi:Retrotransposon gag protein
MAGPRMQANYLLEDELNYELCVRGLFEKNADLSTKQRMFRSVLNDESKTGLSFSRQEKSGFKIEDEEFACKEKYKRIIRALDEATNFKDAKWESRLLHLKSRLQRIINELPGTAIGQHSTILELLNKINSALDDHFPTKKSVQGEIPGARAPDTEVFCDLQENERQDGEEHREDNGKKFEALDLKIKLENQTKTIESLVKENDSLRRKLNEIIGDVDLPKFRQLQQLKNLQEIEIQRLRGENAAQKRSISDCHDEIIQLQSLQSSTGREHQSNNSRPINNHTLPVNKWKPIFFGEEGKGLALNEFLSQIEFLAESECVDEVELHSKIHHLFEGRAKNWLMYARKKYTTWSTLKSELRRTFLSPEFDFRQRRQCEDRLQKRNETFSIYLAEMERMFTSLSDPLTEKQKLEILKRNMKPVYRYAVASTDINSIRDLDLYCGRLDAVGSIEREPLLEGRPRPNFERPRPSVHEIQENGTAVQPTKNEQTGVQNDVLQQNSVGEFATHNEVDEIRLKGNPSNTAKPTGLPHTNNSNSNVHPFYSNCFQNGNTQSLSGLQPFAHSGLNIGTSSALPHLPLPGMFPWMTPEMNNILAMHWYSQIATQNSCLPNQQVPTINPQTQGQFLGTQSGQNAPQQINNSVTAQQSSVGSLRRGCWNCRGSGHSFRQCPVPQTRLFCMRCGNEGVRADQCNNCSQGNEPRRAV